MNSENGIQARPGIKLRALLKNVAVLERIVVLREACVTWQDIASMLGQAGVKVSEATLRTNATIRGKIDELAGTEDVRRKADEYTSSAVTGFMSVMPSPAAPGVAAGKTRMDRPAPAGAGKTGNQNPAGLRPDPENVPAASGGDDGEMVDSRREAPLRQRGEPPPAVTASVASSAEKWGRTTD